MSFPFCLTKIVFSFICEMNFFFIWRTLLLIGWKVTRSRRTCFRKQPRSMYQWANIQRIRKGNYYVSALRRAQGSTLTNLQAVIVLFNIYEILVSGSQKMLASWTLLSYFCRKFLAPESRIFIVNGIVFQQNLWVDMLLGLHFNPLQFYKQLRLPQIELFIYVSSAWIYFRQYRSL